MKDQKQQGVPPQPTSTITPRSRRRRIKSNDFYYQFRILVFVSGLVVGIWMDSRGISTHNIGGDNNGDALSPSSSSSKTSNTNKILSFLNSVPPRRRQPPAAPKMDWISYLQPTTTTTTTTTVIIKMGGTHQSGIGSQICNLIALKIYMNDICTSGYHCNFVVDTTTYYIQYHGDNNNNNNKENLGGDELGFLGGWFTPTFPLIQNQYDLQKVASILPEYNNSSSSNNNWEDWLLSEQQQLQPSSLSPQSQDPKLPKQFDVIMMTNPNLKFVRRFFHPKYGSKGSALYHRFASEACANFQFNDHSKPLLRQIKALHDIPLKATTTTVAFHVRRGDKIGKQGKRVRGESKFFPGNDYVEKLVQVLQQQQQQSPTTTTAITIEHCFVATDDYVAVQEIQDALKANNITCQLHYLVMSHQHGHVTDGNNSWPETVQFMTELALLVEATYFVGTFNSNVGTLVALLRSCSAGSASAGSANVGASATKSKSPLHYYHSYGIDRDDWWFR